MWTSGLHTKRLVGHILERAEDYRYQRRGDTLAFGHGQSDVSRLEIR